MNSLITVGEIFTAEKTNDKFVVVKFKYPGKVWNGVIPIRLVKQGLDIKEDDLEQFIVQNYPILDPSKKIAWIEESEKYWYDNNKQKGQTYDVLKALYSGEWECRVCGPVPKVNPQPAARLSSLKKMGYVIASKRLVCSNCKKNGMHDLLVMMPMIEPTFLNGNELRAPMSDNLKKRIKMILGHKEVCFNVKRTGNELLIDHKFPSQRWVSPESPNPDNMPEATIKRKFQLLSNQTNMWKSRYCDRCVKEGMRGDFMGIKWFYEGGECWQGKNIDDENGCVGCPWYDLEKWKNSFRSQLEKKR
jgi:hypothetical protein